MLVATIRNFGLRQISIRYFKVYNAVRLLCNFLLMAVLTFRLPSYFLRHRLPRKGWVVTTPLRFSVWYKILYSIIQRLIQHCLLNKIVYLNIKYVIATLNYEFFIRKISLGISHFRSLLFL